MLLVAVPHFLHIRKDNINSNLFWGCVFIIDWLIIEVWLDVSVQTAKVTAMDKVCNNHPVCSPRWG